jgi:hypothetical protein
MPKRPGRLFAAASALACAGLLGATGGAVSAATHPAAAAPHSAAAAHRGVPCDEHWEKTSDAIGEYISPWTPTGNDISGYGQNIRFKALSGIDAHYIYSNCGTGPVTKFFNASFYQTETKLGQSGWIQINNDPHTRGFTNPGECAGWDGLFSPPMYRYWKC